MRQRPRRFRPLAAVLAAGLLAACAGGPPAAAGVEDARSSLDRALARAIYKGDWGRAFRLSDSALASRNPPDREVGAYWKAVAWLYRDAPDSAQALLESMQGKWTAGSRKVHGTLLLKLARESSPSHSPARSRAEEIERPPATERALQEKLETLEKETCDLREENQRLETEKGKYQKLLKDLETIR